MLPASLSLAIRRRCKYWIDINSLGSASLAVAVLFPLSVLWRGRDGRPCVWTTLSGASITNQYSRSKIKGIVFNFDLIITLPPENQTSLSILLQSMHRPLGPHLLLSSLHSAVSPFTLPTATAIPSIILRPSPGPRTPRNNKIFGADYRCVLRGVYKPCGLMRVAVQHFIYR